MNDCSIVEVGVACEYLVHVVDGFSFSEMFSRGDEFGEVSSIAEFSDDVGVVFGAEDVVKFNDVGAGFEGVQYIYF